MARVGPRRWPAARRSKPWLGEAHYTQKRRSAPLAGSGKLRQCGAAMRPTARARAPDLSGGSGRVATVPRLLLGLTVVDDGGAAWQRRSGDAFRPHQVCWLFLTSNGLLVHGSARDGSGRVAGLLGDGGSGPSRWWHRYKGLESTNTRERERERGERKRERNQRIDEGGLRPTTTQVEKVAGDDRARVGFLGPAVKGYQELELPSVPLPCVCV